VPRAIEQIIHGDLVLDRIAIAIDSPLAQAGQVQNGLADRFGGNGAGVDADAADPVGAIDQGHALAMLGGIQRRLLPGRTGADNNEIVNALRHRKCP